MRRRKRISWSRQFSESNKIESVNSIQFNSSKGGGTWPIRMESLVACLANQKPWCPVRVQCCSTLVTYNLLPNNLHIAKSSIRKHSPSAPCTIPPSRRTRTSIGWENLPTSSQRCCPSLLQRHLFWSLWSHNFVFHWLWGGIYSVMLLKSFFDKVHPTVVDHGKFKHFFYWQAHLKAP